MIDNNVGCGVCDDGYHVSSSTKICYKNLTGCITYPDDTCSGCNIDYFNL